MQNQSKIIESCQSINDPANFQRLSLSRFMCKKTLQIQCDQKAKTSSLSKLGTKKQAKATPETLQKNQTNLSCSSFSTITATPISTLMLLILGIACMIKPTHTDSIPMQRAPTHLVQAGVHTIIDYSTTSCSINIPLKYQLTATPDKQKMVFSISNLHNWAQNNSNGKLIRYYYNISAKSVSQTSLQFQVKFAQSSLILVKIQYFVIDQSFIDSDKIRGYLVSIGNLQLTGRTQVQNVQRQSICANNIKASFLSGIDLSYKDDGNFSFYNTGIKNVILQFESNIYIKITLQYSQLMTPSDFYKSSKAYFRVLLVCKNNLNQQDYSFINNDLYLDTKAKQYQSYQQPNYKQNKTIMISGINSFLINQANIEQPGSQFDFYRNEKTFILENINKTYLQLKVSYIGFDYGKMACFHNYKYPFKGPSNKTPQKQKKCYNECPQKTYIGNQSYNGTLGVYGYQCRLCSPNCTKCNNDNDCLQCEDGYKIKNDDQIKTCQKDLTNYYQNNGSLIPCNNSNTGCLQCNSQTQCNKCITPFNFIYTNGTCGKCSDMIKNCAECTQTDPPVCLRCFRQYKIATKQLCKLKRDQFQSAYQCTDQHNCKFCRQDDLAYCDECFDQNKTIVNGVCVNLCGDRRIIQGKEQCDDGGTENFDGCSSQCTLETNESLGFECNNDLEYFDQQLNMTQRYSECFFVGELKLKLKNIRKITQENRVEIRLDNSHPLINSWKYFQEPQPHSLGSLFTVKIGQIEEAVARKENLFQIEYRFDSDTFHEKNTNNRRRRLLSADQNSEQDKQSAQQAEKDHSHHLSRALGQDQQIDQQHEPLSKEEQINDLKARFGTILINLKYQRMTAQDILNANNQSDVLDAYNSSDDQNNSEPILNPQISLNHQPVLLFFDPSLSQLPMFSQDNMPPTFLLFNLVTSNNQLIEYNEAKYYSLYDFIKKGTYANACTALVMVIVSFILQSIKRSHGSRYGTLISLESIAITQLSLYYLGTIDEQNSLFAGLTQGLSFINGVSFQIFANEGNNNLDALSFDRKLHSIGYTSSHFTNNAILPLFMLVVVLLMGFVPKLLFSIIQYFTNRYSQKKKNIINQQQQQVVSHQQQLKEQQMDENLPNKISNILLGNVGLSILIFFSYRIFTAFVIQCLYFSQIFIFDIICMALAVSIYLVYIVLIWRKFEIFFDLLSKIGYNENEISQMLYKQIQQKQNIIKTQKLRQIKQKQQQEERKALEELIAAAKAEKQAKKKQMADNVVVIEEEENIFMQPLPATIINEEDNDIENDIGNDNQLSNNLKLLLIKDKKRQLKRQQYALSDQKIQQICVKLLKINIRNKKAYLIMTLIQRLMNSVLFMLFGIIFPVPFQSAFPIALYILIAILSIKMFKIIEKPQIFRYFLNLYVGLMIQIMFLYRKLQIFENFNQINQFNDFNELNNNIISNSDNITNNNISNIISNNSFDHHPYHQVQSQLGKYIPLTIFILLWICLSVSIAHYIYSIRKIRCCGPALDKNKISFNNGNANIQKKDQRMQQIKRIQKKKNQNKKQNKKQQSNQQKKQLKQLQGIQLTEFHNNNNPNRSINGLLKKQQEKQERDPIALAKLKSQLRKQTRYRKGNRVNQQLLVSPFLQHYKKKQNNIDQMDHNQLEQKPEQHDSLEQKPEKHDSLEQKHEQHGPTQFQKWYDKCIKEAQGYEFRPVYSNIQNLSSKPITMIENQSTFQPLNPNHNYNAIYLSSQQNTQPKSRNYQANTSKQKKSQMPNGTFQSMYKEIKKTLVNKMADKYGQDQIHRQYWSQQQSVPEMSDQEKYQKYEKIELQGKLTIKQAIEYCKLKQKKKQKLKRIQEGTYNKKKEEEQARRYKYSDPETLMSLRQQFDMI